MFLCKVFCFCFLKKVLRRKQVIENFLVVQGLGLGIFTTGARVQFLDGELSQARWQKKERKERKQKISDGHKVEFKSLNSDTKLT